MAFRPKRDLWKYFTLIPEESLAECKLCKIRLKNPRSYGLKQHLQRVHKKRDVDKYFDINVLENIAVCKTCEQRLVNRLGNLRLHMRKLHQIELKSSEDKPTKHTHRNKVHKKRDVDKYFHINVSENIAECKTCEQRLVNRLGNLRLHMRRLHQIEVKLPEDKTVGHPPSHQSQDEVLHVAKRKKTEQVANGMKLPSIKIDKNTVIRCVIGLIVEDGVSPDLFSSKHMEAILRPMCEAISDNDGENFKVDEADIESFISSIANYIRKDFSHDLHCRLLSITIDTDLNASPNTFCVSAQFISDGEIQKRILGVIDLEHESELKEDHIKEILYKYNIDSNQIISAFWNNTKGKFNKEVKNSEYLKEMEEFEFYPDIYLGDVKIEPYFGTKAQLCLLDIFKNSNIFQPFLQCRNLAKFISNECNGYYELFDLNYLNIPQLDSPWKAGSTFKMMNDLHEARAYLKNVKFEPFEHPEDQFNLNEELWSFIKAFFKSTNILQKTILKYYNKELHIGDFYAQWLKCKLLTEQLLSAKNEENDYLPMILTEVLKAIENRIKELFNKDCVVGCLFIDPRFQRVLNSSQKERAVEYLKKLWRRAKLYLDDVSEPNEASCQMFVDDDAFLNEFISPDIQVKDNETDDVFKKIDGFKLEFKSVDTNVLLYWRDQRNSEPEIHTLSTICFAIPATEIYNKTLYSNVYPLETDSDMSAFTQENLLGIRVNVHLLNDALSHLQLTNDERSGISLTLSDSELESSDITEDENSNAYSGIMASSTIVNV